MTEPCTYLIGYIFKKVVRVGFPKKLIFQQVQKRLKKLEMRALYECRQRELTKILKTWACPAYSRNSRGQWEGGEVSMMKSR